ncbi:MAG: nucleotide exchange factor GrpE [archaeon]
MVAFNNPFNSNNEGVQKNEGASSAETEEKRSVAENNAKKLVGQDNQEKQTGYESRIKELTETLQRLQAEFENYQKRSTRQNEEYRVFANAKLIEELLPVLDALEQGMQHNKELVLMHEQLFGILKKNGLQKIQIKEGQMFDHDKMECLLQEKNEKFCDGAIASILLNGYLLNGKILRLAKVSVNIKEKKEKEKTKNEKQETTEPKKEGVTKVDYVITKMEE